MNFITNGDLLLEEKFTYNVQNFEKTSSKEINKGTNHNNKQPFECNICQKDFRFESDFNKHTFSIHSVKKPFQSKMCEKEFHRSTTLDMHMVANHGLLEMEPF